MEREERVGRLRTLSGGDVSRPRIRPKLAQSKERAFGSRVAQVVAQDLERFGDAKTSGGEEEAAMFGGCEDAAEGRAIIPRSQPRRDTTTRASLRPPTDGEGRKPSRDGGLIVAFGQRAGRVLCEGGRAATATPAACDTQGKYAGDCEFDYGRK